MILLERFTIYKLYCTIKKCEMMYYSRMPVTRLKALTFDVTNTLLKARSSIGQQYADAALAHGIKADPAALDSAFNSTWDQKKSEMPDYGKHHGVTSREWFSDLVKRVFINAGHRDECPETLSKVFDTLWDHFTVCSFFLTVRHYHIMSVLLKIYFWAASRTKCTLTRSTFCRTQESAQCNFFI